MAKGYRKKNRRVPKETRQSLKLWADGARDTVLRPHIEPYADALDRGWKTERDYLRAVCNEYHVRINWRLKDHEDPLLPLPAYDSTAIQELEELTSDEEVARSARINVLDARIRRWLKYRVKKMRKLFSSKLDFRKNPYAILLSKLSGINSPPKARQAYQQFMHECYTTRIDPVVRRLWADGNKHDSSMANTQPNAAFRAKVARDMFQKLSPSEQVEFSKRAKATAAKAKDEYEKQMVRAPSLAPEDIQQCIDTIPHCIGPLIQGIQDRTKFKFFVMYGGPTPRNNGEVTAYHINFGRNLANQPVYYSAFKQEQHENYTHARWVDFLNSSYTEKDITLSALSNDTKPTRDDSSESESDGTDSSLPSDSEVEERRQKKQQKKVTKKVRANAVVSPRPSAQKTSTPSTSTKSSLAPSKGLPLTIPAVSLPTTAPTSPSSSNPTRVDPALAASASTPAGSAVVEPLVQPTLPKAPVARAAPPGYLATLMRRGKAQQVRSVSAAPQVLVNRKNHPSASQPLPPTPVPPTRCRSADPYAMDLDEDPPSSEEPLLSFRIARKPGHLHVQPLPISMELDLPPRKKRKVTQPTSITRAYLNTKADANNLPSLLTPPEPAAASNRASSAVATPIHSPSPPPEPTTPLPTRSTSPECPATADVSSGTDSALTLVCPPDSAETWFEEAFTSLTQQDLGPDFSAIIRTFTAIETSYNYANPSKGLGARGRPNELTRWVAAGRWRAKMPTVAHPKEFSAAWWPWWASLQPSWREFSPDGKPAIAAYGDNWKTLSFPGQNGVLSVIMALYWWGCAITNPGCPHRGAGSAADWKVAVRDVSWMLDGLLLNLA